MNLADIILVPMVKLHTYRYLISEIILQIVKTSEICVGFLMHKTFFKICSDSSVFADMLIHTCK